MPQIARYTLLPGTYTGTKAEDVDFTSLEDTIANFSTGYPVCWPAFQSFGISASPAGWHDRIQRDKVWPCNNGAAVGLGTLPGGKPGAQMTSGNSVVPVPGMDWTNGFTFGLIFGDRGNFSTGTAAQAARIMIRDQVLTTGAGDPGTGKLYFRIGGIVTDPNAYAGPLLDNVSPTCIVFRLDRVLGKADMLVQKGGVSHETSVTDNALKTVALDGNMRFGIAPEGNGPSRFGAYGEPIIFNYTLSDAQRTSLMARLVEHIT